MDSSPRAAIRPLQDYRDYLLLLVQSRLHGRLQGKLDPSDVVQNTLMEAHRDAGQFRGQNHAQFAAWLRQILARNLANLVRDHGRAKRDVALERSLEGALGESSARLEAFLAAEQSSPSGRAERNEQLGRLARGLSGLPEDQRQALILRHLQGWPLADIGRYFGRSPAAVAGLLHRGLKTLRRELATED